MRGEKRKVCLLMDNASVHKPDMSSLSHVECIMLLPNTTSVIQPCDCGIIMNLKAFYRKSVMAYALDLLEDGNLTEEKMSKAIDIKQAILWIALAWKQVTSQTIINCFAKAFGTL